MTAPDRTIDFSYLPRLTNDTFYPLYTDRHRYLVLWGGAGSGKSKFAAQKWIFRLLNETGHRILIVRKVAKTIRHSCFAELKGVISEWGLDLLFAVKETDMEIAYIPNGNRIICAGLDDVEKIKSIYKPSSIWVEEANELTQADLQQLDLRMRGKSRNYYQIILTFNPVSITHWLKKFFFDQRKDRARTHHSTYKDNRFLDDEYIRVLLDLEQIDEYYFTVYTLGQWGVLGKTVYNARIVTARLMEVQKQKPLCTGEFVYRYENERIVDKSIEFVESDSGFLNIYELPQKGYPYVIGGDTAEGGADFSTLQVRNNINWNQAATFRGHMDTDLYAKQAYCLGRFYNNALIGVETNFDTHPVKELDRLRYPKQYQREVQDTYTGKLQKKFGFKTTKLTRPIIIASHVALVREHIETFNDQTTLEEMLTFVRNENGKPEAQAGSFDDTILADAIALEVRAQQTSKVELQKDDLTGDAKRIHDHIKSLTKKKKVKRHYV